MMSDELRFSAWLSSHSTTARRGPAWPPRNPWHHRDAVRHLHHLDDAGHGARRVGIEGFDRRTEQRRPFEQSHEHAGQFDIQGELSGAVDLCGHVDARRCAARSA
jgi:hypothetical protein